MAIDPNNGKKNDYGERLKRQRKASMIKFYVLAVIIGGLIGLAYIERVVIISVYNSVMGPAPAPVAPSAPAPAAPPEPKVTDAAPAPAAPPKPPAAAPIPPKPPANVSVESISPKEETAARQFLDDGKGYLEAFNFDDATKAFEKASKFKIGTALKDETKVWLKKAVAFQNATKHITIADYARSDNAVAIETVMGDELHGIKIKEDGDNLYLQQVNDQNPAAEGVQKFPIPLNEIKKLKAVSLAKRKADFSEMVLGLESGTTISHSTDYYDLVYLCKRLGLGKECMMYLNRAYDGGPGHEADPNIADSFRMMVVRRVIGRATLLMAGNRRIQVNDELKKLQERLPDFPPATEEIAAFKVQVMDKVKADFKPSLVVNDKKADVKPVQVAVKSDKPKSKAPVREQEVEISVDKVTSAGAAGSVLDKGNVKFEQGMGVIRKYTVGVGGNKADNNKILIQARIDLLEAIDIYEEAIKLEPSNRAIRDRQQTANQMVYFCNKNLIL